MDVFFSRLGQGLRPSSPLFPLTRAYLSFLFKGIVLSITLRNIFILFFVFYHFFETFAHSCKGLKKNPSAGVSAEG
ncbi:hypothetical protein BREVNS_2292 [Brevinematales bacterium NS]|nr:hypothetical protein BREVNS_2292 [Brevinematales bacterium NS]